MFCVEAFSNQFLWHGQKKKSIMTWFGTFETVLDRIWEASSGSILTPISRWEPFETVLNRSLMILKNQGGGFLWIGSNTFERGINHPMIL